MSTKPPTMQERLIHPLNTFEASLNTLIQSLTTTNTFSAAPKAATEIVTADDDLDAALLLLVRHQQNHQTILHMRAEKEALQTKIKDTIFECVRFRKELHSIDPRITDLSDSEDEVQTRNLNPVDYKQLLAFSSHIGRTNATVFLEAQRESQRLEAEARQQREEEREKERLHKQTMPVVNGINHAATAPATNGITTASPRPGTSHTEPTQEARTQIRNAQIEATNYKYYSTMPYPLYEIRKGRLGRLQEMLEQDGEPAVEAEVERLVRESELRKKPEPEPALEVESVVEPEGRGDQRQAQRPREPAPPRKMVNLDFPEDDSSDEEG
ncbi:hypothetical protein LTR05_005843 [Lithohypha guttulata]|uniref:Mediator of RNA polymerase II transcription subunit 4 n=1 Tax=Lithohypha guttulata TaxID=1690604 RepID=A0AAN7YFW5_9EURO|nr:hypothetical protein LTR05_005843 [Lithohypha guttulata]